MADFSSYLESLKASGNFRSIPRGMAAEPPGFIDFSSNDYLGLGAREDLREEFFKGRDCKSLSMTSSASRLLASQQDSYRRFEATLERLYPGRKALLFNSGYHANAGMISALADRSSLVLADRLVHASIIDGVTLSRAEMVRFPHNDFDRLEALLDRAKSKKYSRILVVVESVYSMDGDSADLERLIAIKRRYPDVILYVDEAHAFGVCGEDGLGLVAHSSEPAAFDVVIATLGKAAASYGAFVITSEEIVDVAVNRARSFIFSTAMPPLCVEWSDFIVNLIPTLGGERAHLREIAALLHAGLQSLRPDTPMSPSHIRPFIIGDPHRTIEMSQRLRDRGLVVLPIRTPTVPPGTERLRISLSAGLSCDSINRLLNSITALI